VERKRDLLVPLKMKTVLITGANRGIGLALAKHYVERGDNGRPANHLLSLTLS